MKLALIRDDNTVVVVTRDMEEYVAEPFDEKREAALLGAILHAAESSDQDWPPDGLYVPGYPL
jgi:hypothetical protein